MYFMARKMAQGVKSLMHRSSMKPDVVAPALKVMKMGDRRCGSFRERTLQTK